jgi:hypothetical protein
MTGGPLEPREQERHGNTAMSGSIEQGAGTIRNCTFTVSGEDNNLNTHNNKTLKAYMTFTLF